METFQVEESLMILVSSFIQHKMLHMLAETLFSLLFINDS